MARLPPNSSLRGIQEATERQNNMLQMLMQLLFRVTNSLSQTILTTKKKRPTELDTNLKLKSYFQKLVSELSWTKRQKVAKALLDGAC